MANDVSKDFLTNPGARGAQKNKYKPGVYKQKTNDVEVEVKVDNTSIKEMNIDIPSENADVANQLKKAILLNQNTAVDVVTGASVLSSKIINSTQKCLDQAEGKDNTKTVPKWLGKKPVIKDKEISKTVVADIVIMGGGDAGAFAAAEKGADVAVIEAQSKDNIFYYGLHDIAAVNSKFQLSHGMKKIKPSEFLAEYQRRSHNRTDPKLIKKFIDNSGEMVDWLQKEGPKAITDKSIVHNVDYRSDYTPEGNTVNRFSAWAGTVQYDFNGAASYLVEKAESRHARWYWETRGIELVSKKGVRTVQAERTDKNGKVTFYQKAVPVTKIEGVIAKDKNGNYIKFLARKAVVLTGGDYGGNSEMYQALQDEKRGLYEAHGLDTSNMRCAGFGRDGSGIKMALWEGATLDPGPRCLVDPQVVLHSDNFASNVLRWGASFSHAVNPWGAPFVWLDSTGRRFTDETVLGVFGMRNRVDRRKPGRYYCIFDKHWVDLMARSTPEHFSIPVGRETLLDLHQEFDKWVKRGPKGAETNSGDTTCAWGAQTLDELLDYMGFDDEHKKTIKEEIAKYNSFCKSREDKDFGRDPNMLLPVNEPPYFGMYCVEERPMTGTVTLNGVNIDSDQRVLDKNFNPIENLYASGNNSGERFAIEYNTPMQGLTCGLAMTLGRVLGKELAEKEGTDYE